MEVTLAVLADYSNISKEGKLNILGMFNTIYAKSFPMTHHSMQLVIRFESPLSEAGTEKKIQVRLMDADGKMILNIGGQLILPNTTRAGTTFETNQILNINNLVFQKDGDYAFCILIGGDEKRRVPLKVVQVPQS